MTLQEVIAIGAVSEIFFRVLLFLLCLAVFLSRFTKDPPRNQ